MNAQKERKIEYKREHFAVLRRKRMDQRDSSVDTLFLRSLSGAFAAHGCAPTTHGPMPEPTPGLTPEPVTITITVPPATPGPTPLPLPDEYLKRLSKEEQKEIILNRSRNSGASDTAEMWISAAADLLGAPYPPVENGKIQKKEGTYHCAQVIQEALKTSNINVGSSCRKQENDLCDNDNWEYNKNAFNINDLKPGDIIYWVENGNSYPTHTGIYCGNGYMIDSTRSGGGVAYRPVDAFQTTPENSNFEFYAYARFNGN